MGNLHASDERSRVRVTANARRLTAVALTALMAFSAPAFAASCVQSNQATAFALRHLQSRLMVAALSCNQRDAYNAFVSHFQPALADGGRSLSAYFDGRGGKRALNSYITEIANAAGLDRAADPRGFCRQTWEVFMNLEDAPENLMLIAQANMMSATNTPAACQPDTPRVAAAKMEAAAARQDAAAGK
jgi:hypothetical protein